MTFLDGFIVQDMNNGSKMEKLSKDFKGILSCAFDDHSIFIGTTKCLFEINKNNGNHRRLLKNYNIKQIYIYHSPQKNTKQLIATTNKGIVLFDIKYIKNEPQLFDDISFIDAKYSLVEDNIL